VRVIDGLLTVPTCVTPAICRTTAVPTDIGAKLLTVTVTVLVGDLIAGLTVKTHVKAVNPLAGDMPLIPRQGTVPPTAIPRLKSTANKSAAPAVCVGKMISRKPWAIVLGVAGVAPDGIALVGVNAKVRIVFVLMAW
jgi:hypothetical protein